MINIICTNGKVSIPVVEGMRLSGFARKDGYITVPFQKKFTAKSVLERFFGERLYPADEIPQMYRDAGDILGVSVAKFADMLNGAIWSTYIKPNIEYHRRWSLEYNGKAHNQTMVKLTNRRIKYVKKFASYGMKQVDGFGLLFDNTHHAKVECGSKLWKDICHNSITRNDRIVKLAVQTLNCRITPPANLLRFLNTVPSTLLNASILPMYEMFENREDIMAQFVSHINTPMYKVRSDDIERVYHTYRDCKRMLGNQFNPVWGLKRITMEHHKAAKKRAAERYSDTEFPTVALYPNTFEYSCVSATLVKSGRDIAILANEMHNCIASYVDSCKQGDFVIYKVIDEVGRTSAYGLDTVRLSEQHYEACDGPVQSEAARELIKIIRDKILQRHTPLLPDGDCIHRHTPVPPNDGEMPF